jgi:hypothetical protein
MKRKGPKKPIDPLKLTCTKTDCQNDLHAFRPDKKTIKHHAEGECVGCHQKLVDFEQTRRRDLGEVDETFEQMKREYVRHWFWSNRLNAVAHRRALTKGPAATEAEMRKRLRTAIGGAKPFRDGFQTPIDDPKNIVYWAQHATASCCRRCVEYWHGIPRGQELTESEIDYLLRLAMKFIEQKMAQSSGDSSSSSSSDEGSH